MATTFEVALPVRHARTPSPPPRTPSTSSTTSKTSSPSTATTARSRRLNAAAAGRAGRRRAEAVRPARTLRGAGRDETDGRVRHRHGGAHQGVGLLPARGPRPAAAGTGRRAMARTGMRHVVLERRGAVGEVPPGRAGDQPRRRSARATPSTAPPSCCGRSGACASALLHGGGSSVVRGRHTRRASRGAGRSRSATRGTTAGRSARSGCGTRGWERRRPRSSTSSTTAGNSGTCSTRGPAGRPPAPPSASVVAPTAAEADAMSTAFFVLGAAGAEPTARPRPHLGAVVLPEDDRPTPDRP